MSAVQIPLAALPSQEVSIRLGQQSCRLHVYQKRTGLFLDLSVNDVRLVSGILCRDRTWLIRTPAAGFSGDLAFVDTQGTQDPDHTGLSDRFQLIWSN